MTESRIEITLSREEEPSTTHYSHKSFIFPFKTRIARDAFIKKLIAFIKKNKPKKTVELDTQTNAEIARLSKLRHEISWLENLINSLD